MKTFKQFNEKAGMADLYKLYTKAMKTMPGSPAQKKIEMEITKLRKELGLDEQSYSGVPFGTYHPIADLNAAAGDAQISKSDLDSVEKYADRLYKAVGIDVEFTRHFLDRVNDARNKKQITVAELIRLFKQSFKKHGKKIAALGPDAEAVLNDMQTDVNMPFALKWDGKELDLIAKTVMRKPNFATSNQKLSF